MCVFPTRCLQTGLESHMSGAEQEIPLLRSKRSVITSLNVHCVFYISRSDKLVRETNNVNILLEQLNLALGLPKTIQFRLHLQSDQW